jgi:hypothetical protein
MTAVPVQMTAVPVQATAARLQITADTAQVLRRHRSINRCTTSGRRDGRARRPAPVSRVHHQFQEVVVNQQQLLQVQSLRRAKAFLDDHPDVAGALNTTNAKRQLDDAVARLGTTAVEQDTRSRQVRGETGRRKQLERDLRVLHMSPIAEFARAKLKGSPNFAALTPAALRLYGERLANTALAMADAAEPYAAQFTEAQFPTDFLAQLRTSAQAVLASIDAKAKQKGQRVGATQEIDRAIKQGRAGVFTLNPVIRRALKKESALFAEWRSASRVEKKAVRSTDTAPATGGTPAPVAPAPVANAAPTTEVKAA